MDRGWEVELADGTILQEGQVSWKQVPKNKIVRLSLFYGGRSWNIHNKTNYFIKNRASTMPFVQDSFQLESRTIGYYDGPDKICYTVNELTGEFKLEVISNA